MADARSRHYYFHRRHFSTGRARALSRLVEMEFAYAPRNRKVACLHFQMGFNLRSSEHGAACSRGGPLHLDMGPPNGPLTVTNGAGLLLWVFSFAAAFIGTGK